MSIPVAQSGHKNILKSLPFVSINHTTTEHNVHTQTCANLNGKIKNSKRNIDFDVVDDDDLKVCKRVSKYHIWVGGWAMLWAGAAVRSRAECWLYQCKFTAPLSSCHLCWGVEILRLSLVMRITSLYEIGSDTEKESQQKARVWLDELLSFSKEQWRNYVIKVRKRFVCWFKKCDNKFHPMTVIVFNLLVQMQQNREIYN